MNRTNLLFRRLLRVGCSLILLLYLIFRITLPLIQNKPIYLDHNDGYIIGSCFVVLLSINAVKNAIDKFLNKGIIQFFIERYLKKK